MSGTHIVDAGNTIVILPRHSAPVATSITIAWVVIDTVRAAIWWSVSNAYVLCFPHIVYTQQTSHHVAFAENSPPLYSFHSTEILNLSQRYISGSLFIRCSLSLSIARIIHSTNTRWWCCQPFESTNEWQFAK